MTVDDNIGKERLAFVGKFDSIFKELEEFHNYSKNLIGSPISDFDRKNAGKTIGRLAEKLAKLSQELQK